MALNGAKRLNGLNVWNGLIFMMNGAKRQLIKNRGASIRDYKSGELKKGHKKNSHRNVCAS
jgi:hypothetical protein